MSWLIAKETYTHSLETLSFVIPKSPLKHCYNGDFIRLSWRSKSPASRLLVQLRILAERHHQSKFGKSAWNTISCMCQICFVNISLKYTSWMTIRLVESVEMTFLFNPSPLEKWPACPRRQFSIYFHEWIFEFQWCLFSRVQLTRRQYWFR